jgi:hypothetical protein
VSFFYFENSKEDHMVVGKITVCTCYGDAEIPVEVRGKGPRPGTAWVTALNGLQPFTKMSHGGPYQDNSAVVQTFSIRDVKIVPDEEEPSPEVVQVEPVEEPVLISPEIFTPSIEPELVGEGKLLPADWFLESAYEDRTCFE